MCVCSGSTVITVTGTNLLTIQEPKVRAKYEGIETNNVRTEKAFQTLEMWTRYQPKLIKASFSSSVPWSMTAP